MLPGQKFTPEDVLAVFKRWWWLVVPPLAIGLALGVLVFRLIPVKYQSETLIMVVPQRVPDEYVKATVTSPIEDRLSSISDQIMSRSRLERIITDLNLYRGDRAKGALMEDVVRRMRADIKVTVENKDGFRVNYISDEPSTAQKVTERLATLFIDENLRDRENQAQNTNDFLQSQLEDARRRLVEHEKKLEAYRQRYAGQLPTQMPGNLQAIQNAQLQLQSLDESTNRARERRLLLERQLADAQVTATAVTTATPAGGSGDAAAPMSTAQQLDAAQTRLAAFRLRYTADHPDVKALERTVRELQARLQEEAKNPAAPRPLVVSPEEVARRKRISDLQAEITVIDHQIAANGRGSREPQRDDRGLPGEGGCASGPRIRARRAHARLHDPAADVREPPPEAGRLEAGGESRAPPDWRAVQGAGSRVNCRRGPTTRRCGSGQSPVAPRPGWWSVLRSSRSSSTATPA